MKNSINSPNVRQEAVSQALSLMGSSYKSSYIMNFQESCYLFIIPIEIYTIPSQTRIPTAHPKSKAYTVQLWTFIRTPSPLQLVSLVASKTSQIRFFAIMPPKCYFGTSRSIYKETPNSRFCLKCSQPH